MRFSIFAFLLCYCFPAYNQNRGYESAIYTRLIQVNSPAERLEKTLHSADSLFEKNNYSDLTLFLYRAALNLTKENNLAHKEVEIMLKIGSFYESRGDLKKAMSVYSELLKSKIVNDSVILKGELYIHLGFSHHKLLNEKEALAFYNKALKLYLDANYEVGLGQVYKGLAVLSRRALDYGKAKEYSARAKTIFVKHNLMREYASTLYNECSDYFYANDPEGAKRIVFQAIAIEKKLNTKKSLVDVITEYMACVYIFADLRQYDSAYYYLNLGKRLSDSLGRSQADFMMYYEKLGYYYKSMGKNEGAIKAYKEALRDLNNENSLYAHFLYDEIASAFARDAQNDSAYHYGKIALDVQDEVYANELNQNLSASEQIINLMELDFANQKKVLEAEREKERLNKINLILLLTTGALFLLILLIAVFYRNRNLKTKEESLISQLDFLRAQLNPHFLFNSINNIYVLMDIDPGKASTILLKFSELLRYQLYECNVPEIKLSKEIQFIENFILFEKLRYGDKLNVTFRIKSPDMENLMIAPLILQPFIENAFKHVPKSRQHDNYVIVDLEVRDKTLKLYVENNFNINETGSLPGGIGLNNVKKRLDLIYKEKYSIINRKENNVYCVNLDLKLKHD